MRGVYLILFLLCINIAFGLGIATQPMKDSTLKMLPGESVLFKVELQNGADEDTYVKFELISEIGFVVDFKDSYFLEANTYDTVLFINLTVPQNASLLTEYPVKISVVPIVPEEDRKGTIPMSFKVSKSFKVLVVDELGQTKRPIVKLEKPAQTEPKQAETIPETVKNSEQETNRALPILFILALSAIVLMLWHKSSRLSKHIVENQHSPKTHLHTYQSYQNEVTAPLSAHAKPVKVHTGSEKPKRQLHLHHIGRLHTYVKKSLEEGYTPESIRLLLYDRGWQKHYIDHVIPASASKAYQTTQEKFSGMQDDQPTSGYSETQKQRLKEMVAYVQRTYQQGIPPYQIHASLVSAGWNSTIASKAISHVTTSYSRRLNDQP